MAKDTSPASIVLRVDYGDQPPEVLARLVGPQGERGERGLRGDPGPKGEKGDPGEKGDTGLRGLKGDTGDTGRVGNQGDSGPPGSVPAGSVVFWSGDQPIPDGWTATNVTFPEWWKGVWAPFSAPIAIVKE